MGLKGSSNVALTRAQIEAIAANAVASSAADIQQLREWLAANEGMEELLASMFRTNRPIVNSDYTLDEKDAGVVLNTPGTTVTLPTYSDYQRGKDYGVKNGSTGLVTAAVAAGDGIVIQGQLVQSVTIPSDFSRQFARETTTNHWIIL